MSYDILLVEPGTHHTILLPESHNLRGGTYAIGGTNEAWLNVTYNYSQHFYRVMGTKGIRSIYGLTGEASIPLLERAIEQLGNDFDADYWAPTEGNAKTALQNLLTLAQAAPHGVWEGD